jgi:SAM-dependent methyltransferase
MKLSDLVAYKSALDQVSVDSIQVPADLAIKKIAHLVDSQPEQMGTFQQQLCQHNNIINQEFKKLSDTVDQLSLQVQQQIEIQEKYWLQESYRLFENEMRSEHHDYILNRRPQITPETILRSRLRMYCDWKYPGMIIRPGLETLASEMVGFDPLYLIDTSPDLLGKVSSINNFSDEYQARLRNIVIQETLDSEILEKIPNNQFGLCLVYNFFNFRPLEYVRKYLNEIYQKLKPGGVLIMTYNDCSRVPGVLLAEKHFACYTPGRLITDLTEHIGFDRLHTWHNNGPSTFLEIRKPGELSSLRGGQTLAKIIHKSVAESK